MAHSRALMRNAECLNAERLNAECLNASTDRPLARRCAPSCADDHRARIAISVRCAAPYIVLSYRVIPPSAPTMQHTTSNIETCNTLGRIGHPAAYTVASDRRHAASTHHSALARKVYVPLIWLADEPLCADALAVHICRTMPNAPFTPIVCALLQARDSAQPHGEKWLEE